MQLRVWCVYAAPGHLSRRCRSRLAYPPYYQRAMLLTIAVLLLILWFLGVITAFTIGGFIHLLLLIAVVMIVIRLVRGEDPFRRGTRPL